MPATNKVHTKYMYNNYMYLLAGYVAEKLSRKSWEDLTTDQIFKPLNMTRSTFIKKLDIATMNAARSYYTLNGSLEEMPVEVLE